MAGAARMIVAPSQINSRGGGANGTVIYHIICEALGRQRCLKYGRSQINFNHSL